MAGRLTDLERRPRPAAWHRVQLQAGDPHQLAQRTATIDATLAGIQPQSVLWAGAGDVASLTECAEEDLLFEVLVDATPAGVVAAVRDDDHAMSGLSVQELCVGAAYRGQGLAGAILRRLPAHLPAEADDVLWGTIHPQNAPSLRNARSFGSVPVGGYVWVTPSELPGMRLTEEGEQD